jgi:hypothetical protein
MRSARHSGRSYQTEKSLKEPEAVDVLLLSRTQCGYVDILLLSTGELSFFEGATQIGRLQNPLPLWLLAVTK